MGVTALDNRHSALAGSGHLIEIYHRYSTKLWYFSKDNSYTFCETVKIASSNVLSVPVG